MRVGIGVFARAPSGLAVGTVDAALALRALGVDVVLFAMHDAELPARAEGLSECIVRLPALRGPLARPLLSEGLFLASRLAHGRNLDEAVRAHPVDVLHSFSPGMAPPLRRPLPVAVQAWQRAPSLGRQVLDDLRLTRRRPLSRAAHILRDTQGHAVSMLGYRRAQAVLSGTPTVTRALLRCGLPAHTVPPPIEVPHALPAREPADGLRVAFCAHPLDSPVKGLLLLLDALEAVRARPLALTLYGGWSAALGQPVARVRAAGVEVRVAGLVPRERYLDDLARRTDLLAFPSAGEEWGYALFEALSRGVPAVAFDVPPFADVLDADTGLLARAGDGGDLASALSRAAAGPLPGPEAVRAAVRRRAGSEVVARSLLGLYEDLAGRGGSPRAARDAALARNPAP